MSARAFTFQKRRNGIVTTNTDHYKFYEVVLHNTTVFVMNDSLITLNSGGWRTNTTKTAINRAFDLLDIPARLWQKKFEWFVTYDGTTFDFEDGMNLDGRLRSVMKKLDIF
jgi:hypothetical protein